MYAQLSETIGANNGSICDQNGSLLFYANGCKVFNSNHEMMENGGDINPGDRHDAHCLFGNYPGTQNSIIIPVPNTEDQYYYIHKTWARNDMSEIEKSEILWTLISFESNPLGEVILKNTSLNSGSKTLSGFTEAINHKNGVDWWVIDFTEGPEENFYLAYLVNKDSIFIEHKIEIENIGSLTNWCSSTSQSCFSPDGKKLAKMCPDSGFDLWDFDRSTGLISNYKHLPIETNYVRCGVGISPNSRFAYLSCSDSLWQVDLWEEDLSIGLELIDTLDKTAAPSTVTNFGYQQLGPDCKIYMNTIRQYDWLHVINSPDEKGKDCDFRQHSIKLPHLNETSSFPNFPHFRIDEEDVCDPTITSVFGLPVESESQIVVFPNPTSGLVTLKLPETRPIRYSVSTVTGNVILTSDSNVDSEISIDLTLQPSGLYFIELVFGDGSRNVEKVVRL